MITRLNHSQAVRISTALALVTSALSPLVTFAQGLADKGVAVESTGLGQFIINVQNFANGTILPALLAIGFVVFVWGIFQYFIVGGANDEAKEKGKSLMIYATLGFVFIVIFWGLVNFLAGTVGLEGEGLQNQPSALPTP